MSDSDVQNVRQFKIDFDTDKAMCHWPFKKQAKQYAVSCDLRPIGDLPIVSLGFSVRVLNVFHQSGIRYVGELNDIHREFLYGLPNFGRTSMMNVVSCIEAEVSRQIVSGVDPGRFGLAYCSDDDRSVDEPPVKHIRPISPSSVWDYVEMLSDDRLRTMIQLVLSGRSFTEVSEEYSLTRERVRQLVDSVLRTDNAPLFAEMRYMPYFEKYKMSEELFCNVFDAPKYAYYYLNIMCDVPVMDRRSLCEVDGQGIIPDDAFKRLMKYEVDGCRFVEGEWVRINIVSMFDTYFKHHCVTPASVDDIINGYMSWARDNKLPSRCFSKGKTNLRFINILIDGDNCLMSVNRQWRYYDVSKVDAAEFWKRLCLDSYLDMDISTDIIFRDMPDVMLMYDIRDRNELHGLMRRLADQCPYQIEFRKMPTVRIGNADRSKQVQAVFDMMPPGTSVSELAAEYEKCYGVSHEVAANLFCKFFADNGINVGKE